jgi:transcriptional regulator with GAF, ATPase, and Fis domain
MAMLVDPPGSSLPGHRLCEGVLALFTAARARLPVASLSVLQPGGRGEIVLTISDGVGTSGHRELASGITRAFLPANGIRQITERDLEAHSERMIEARLLLMGMPESVRQARTQHAVLVPLPDRQPNATLVVGLSSPGVDERQLTQIAQLGADVWQLMNREESTDEELARLRRLAALETVLPALVEALDIREIFERVSELSKPALGHDFLSVGTFSEDRQHLRLYAQTSDWKFPEAGVVPFAPILVDTFTYHFIGNLPDNPLNTSTEQGSDFGARSSLRVPVRVNTKVVAALNFSSRETDRYGAADVSVAQRVAEYVALALSHQRLAEESHRAAALQERETNLKMLDGLLSTLAGVLDVREVFHRVSEIAKQVLPHDLMGLPLYATDGEHLIVHAVVGAEPTTRPIPLSPMYRRLLAEPWDHLIIDDILVDPDLRDSLLVPTGVRSLMRVAIRLERRLVGLLDFGMFTTGFYKPEHALIARRIADHVALALSHQRLSEESQRATALAERTANLAMLDELLNTISGVLDIREVFDRVSQIAKRVLPHDMMALPLASPDGQHILVYAIAGGLADAPPPRMLPFPETHRGLFEGTWDHFIFDDVQTHPLERDQPPAQGGYHSLLRVAIRLEGKLVGVLDFGSFTVGFYTPADALLGRRIADHIALVLSHQRLADEIRRATALAERTTNLEMLDGLLGAVTGVLDIREVFERVSEIAKRVLPHDAMALPIVTDDREHIIRFATTGIPTDAIPRIQPIHESVRPLLVEPWDVHNFDDIANHLEAPIAQFARLGYRSMMRVAVRLEGQMVGALVFFSRTLAAFSQADSLIARRIADHIALVISHQRLADESRKAAALQERAASLDALDGLLNAVAGVLDVRSVFDRISQIGNTVMPHDAMTIAVRSGKPGIVRLYAATGDLSHLAVPMEIPVRNPRLLTEPWEFELLDDIASDPQYASAPARIEGMRSILVMPIRIAGELIGGVNFLSRGPGRFTRDDVPMARRITDHIALALSHEQLAEEMRKSQELRSREANVGLLDALLASVTDTGELRTVFDRVADIAQKVLPFDAMAVPVLTADREHVTFHVLRAPEGMTFPEVMEVSPHLRGTNWEYDLCVDLQADPRQNTLWFATRGFRSALRIAIRVEGQLTSGVGFYSFKPGVYTEADVAIGRRVSARIAISLMREQGMQATRRADEASQRASRLESRVQALTDELNARAGFHRVVGKSTTWRQALTQATQVASTETTVLLLGESGTGKEVVARFIHRASTRKNGPFVALNCAALPEQLLESELFGYERGAFTGAMNARAGKIEQAAGGVLFLDEVGEMSPTVQAKFLRVLQEREFQRLGGSKTLKADARVIAATNRDPKAAMERGQFREDLYYRLSVFEISLPPLRDRRDDILLLVETFLADLATNIGRPAGGLSEDAKDRLLSYHWPGNVRELRNAIERAVILAEGGLITSEHLPIAVGQTKPASSTIVVAAPAAGEGSATLPSGLTLDALERDLLNKAMTQAKNNKSQAAKLLGVPRGQFYSLLKKHGLTDAKR